jgi:hypothetical protein
MIVLFALAALILGVKYTRRPAPSHPLAN